MCSSRCGVRLWVWLVSASLVIGVIYTILSRQFAQSLEIFEPSSLLRSVFAVSLVAAVFMVLIFAPLFEWIRRVLLWIFQWLCCWRTIIVHLRAVAFLAVGQANRAFDDLKLGFRLSDSIKDEPILISHLVRIAVLQMDLQILYEGLARHSWNEAQLAEIQRYFDSRDLLAELKNAMRGEQAFGLDYINYLRRQGSVNFDDWGVKRSPRKLLGLLLGGYFYQNMLTIARLHEKYDLPSIDPKAHRIFPELAEDAEKVVNQLHDHGFHPYARVAFALFPALSSAEAKSASMQTFVDEGRVACALERYRLANGNFPESLSVLTPNFLDSIPTDVIDGQPLRYRKISENRYVLYSVGWNKTDDGGLPGWRDEKEKTISLFAGDWVWIYPDK